MCKDSRFIFLNFIHLTIRKRWVTMYYIHWSTFLPCQELFHFVFNISKNSSRRQCDDSIRITCVFLFIAIPNMSYRFVRRVCFWQQCFYWFKLNIFDLFLSIWTYLIFFIDIFSLTSPTTIKVLKNRIKKNITRDYFKHLFEKNRL